VLGGIVLAALLAVVCMRAPVGLRAGAVLWLLGWVPVSHLIAPLRTMVVADRYMLFATLGFAVMIAFAILRITSTRARYALTAAIVAAALLRSWDAQSNWRDAESLWERAVTVNPDDGGAWSMYADAVASSGQRDRARAIVQEGKQHSREPRLLMREALFLVEAGDRAAGIALMRQAASAGEYRAMSNLALLLHADGAKEEALAWARRSVQQVPRYEQGQRTLGKIALELGRTSEALAAFERAYALQPHHLSNRYNLGLALIALGRGAEARPHLEACTSDPALAAGARALLQRR
jgi:tetratricopeptide (TPR) repeat protein